MTMESSYVSQFHTNLQAYQSATTLSQLQSLISSGHIRLPISTTGCQEVPIILSNASVSTAPSYEFSIHINVDKFGPVIFMDYFGIGAYTYLQKSSSSNDIQGGRIARYCDGYKYTGHLYRMAPRPVCPQHSAKYRTIGYGKVVIYKKNVVSYNIPAYICGITQTLITSFGRSLGGCYDNYPGASFQAPGDLNACKGSYAQKKFYPNFNQDLDLNTYTNDTNQFIFCGPTPSRCRDWVSNLTIYDPRNMFYPAYLGGNGTSGPGYFLPSSSDDSYYYGLPRVWKCNYISQQHDYYRRAHILPTNLTVIMPDYYAQLPLLGNVDRPALSKGHLSSKHYGTAVWNASLVNDLCAYVPRLVMNVETIVYKSSGIMSGIIAGSMRWYVNDDMRVSMSTTEDMEVPASKRDKIGGACFQQTARDKVYYLRNGDLMVFTEMTKDEYKTAVLTMGFTKHPVHSTVRHVHKPTAQAEPIAVLASPDADTTVGVLSSLSNMLQNPPQTITAVEALDYVELQSENERIHNMHVRAMQDCHQSVVMWDNVNQLLHIDPSVGLSQRLNIPVQATHGGNGFYNFKLCEKIVIHQVLESLYTNDTNPVYVSNGVYTSIRDIVLKKGVKNPQPDICLTYPLVVFSTVNKPKQKMLGQMSFSGVIDVMQLSHFAYCDQTKNYAFVIGNTTYFYTNYVLSSTFDINDLNEANADAVNNADSNRNTATPDHSLIHPIDITYHGEHETVTIAVPSQLVSTFEYTIEERQSAVVSMADLIAETNRLQYEQRLAVQTGDYVRSGSSGFLQGFGSLGGGLLTGLVHEADSLISKAASGVGSSIMSTLKAVLTPLLIGLVVVIVIVIGLKILYSQVLANNHTKQD